MRLKSYMGFTYVGLLFILAIIGITLAMAGTLWSFAQQREKERELIFVGNQFRQAIGMYYEKTPGVVKRYPQSLENLLEDDRYVSVQRYLRKIYKDPMTTKTDWELIYSPEGGVMGLHSNSNLHSIKTRGFLVLFNVKLTNHNYAEWDFLYSPPVKTQK